ncbi:unnamed protein product [Closterium sp. NIES-64]|nr:unnamed protein product [Closterium sp. NIES-64]
MATPSVLAFDAEGRAIDFEVWLDNLQLFLQCDRADGLSLFDLTSGASPAPAADADPTVRSQWATRDAAARLAVRRHLPTSERAHFSQYKSAQTLYDAVVARYSSPATAALSRLMLPYLFPDLSAFPTVADLITHLRTSDTRYRAALPAEFCAKNPPPMYIALYYVVARLPDSLRVVRDHFLAVCPTTLTVDLLEKALLAAEKSNSRCSRSARRLPLVGDVAPARARGARARVELEGAVAVAAVAAEGVGVAAGLVAGVVVVVAAAAETVVVVAAVVVEAAAEVEAAEVEAVEAAAEEAVVVEEVELVGVVPSSRSGGGGGQRSQRQQQQRSRDIPPPQQLRECEENEGYRCFQPDPGIGTAALGACEAAALGASASALSGTVSLADPSGGPVLSHFSTVLPCPAAPSGTLSGLYLPSFSTNLVSGAALQDVGVHEFIPASQRVTHCTDARTCRHLATFSRRPGSSLYTLTTSSPPVPASGQVAASGQVLAAASRLSLLSPPGQDLPVSPVSRVASGTTPHSSHFPPTEAPLQTLHMDVWGPAPVRGQGHERYFLLVVDDYSRYTTVLPLRSKGAVTEVLIDWIREARLQLRKSFGSDFPVLRLHSDRGGEFSSRLLRDYCRARGIRQTFTLPDSPQQNGIAERRIGMVMDVARTSMMHAAAPHFLWPFAVRYAAHQLNLHPRVSRPAMSPALLWTGKVGDASVFRVWGSRAFVRDLSADKLSPRAAPCVFLGFPTDAPGWQFYRPSSRRVLSSQDVTFDESVPFYRLFPYRTPSLPPPPDFVVPVPPPVDPLPPQVPAPSGVSQVDAVDPVEVTGDSGAAAGAEPGGADSGGAVRGGAEPGGATAGGAGPGGAAAEGAEPGGAEPGGAVPGGAGSGGAGSGAAEPGGAELGAAEPGGAASGAAEPGVSPAAASRREPLSPQELREWFARRWRRAAESGGAAGAGAGASSTVEGAGAAGPGAARPAGPPGAGAAEGVGAEPTTVGPAAGDPSFESTAASALVAELVDFAARCRLDYAASLVADWQAAMDAEMASWKSTGTYVDAVPPPGANIVSGMWIFRVKRPPGSPPVFKARYVARGFSQRQGVDYFQTFSLTPKMTTLRVLLHIAAQRDYELHSLDFSTAFLQGSLHEEIWLRRPPSFTGTFPPGTQWSLRRPVYGLRQAPREWHDTLRTTLAALGFAPSTADPSLFLRTDTSLPQFYILVYVDDLVFATADTAGLAYVKSELLKRHTCTDLEHMAAAKRVLRYLCSTSGMGLVLGGRSPVVLTGHADASCADDQATQRSSQGYTFSLGSGSVSWRSTCSSSVLGSSCEAEIYAGAMAAQELRWLTYLLTDLGEPPRSPPVLYVDNKAMLALCREQRLEHRTKHIALRYFLARELQQRGQLRLAYVASEANTADVFTKALAPCDHQRFCTQLGLVPVLPHLLSS